MFALKKLFKAFLLPPLPWLLMLLAVWIFWRRRWARKLLLITILLTLVFHSGPVGHLLSYHLESRYPPLRDPAKAGSYDAIVVLTSGSFPATGLIPFPSIDSAMFRRLDEAWRLYRIKPKPIIVSGGHANPFTPAMDENKIARDFLIRWGVPAKDVIGEENSRDTFENALETGKLLQQRGWKRYLLVTSALHMPRSMMVFTELVAEPIAAPGDFNVGEFALTPFELFPNEGAAERISAAIHEYVGMANYYLRLRFSGQ